jgi:hypothetical protein
VNVLGKFPPASLNALLGPADGRHHRITDDAVLPTDRLDVYICSNPVEAMTLEMELIYTLKPTLNRARPSAIYMHALRTGRRANLTAKRSAPDPEVAS